MNYIRKKLKFMSSLFCMYVSAGQILPMLLHNGVPKMHHFLLIVGNINKVVMHLNNKSASTFRVKVFLLNSNNILQLLNITCHLNIDFTLNHKLLSRKKR